MVEYELGRISVIVPIYNAELYLERCIDSIIAQTYKNLEIILIDDGSTDRSRAICETYAKKDSRIRVLCKCNGGASSARNMGIEIATGEYIGFVDSDDYIALDMYESFYNLISEDVDLVCCGSVCFDKGGHKTVTGYAKTSVCWDNMQAVRELLVGRYLTFSPWDKLYKRELIGENRFPEKRISEDLPFIYNVLKKCKRVVNIGSCKYFYCHRSDSVSRKPFYGRRIDFVLFTRDIVKDVSFQYPSLRKESELLYIKCLIDIIWTIDESPNRSRYECMRKRLVRAVKNMILLIVLNPLLSYEQKKYCVQLK